MTSINVTPTLPGTDYYTDEVYELDKERVFFRNWLYVGRASRWEKAGSWLTFDIAGESILLVRGKDDQIRGFYNVCRHRGARLCEEAEGQTKSSIRCPYHAWGYGLDGKLVSTPNVDRGEVDMANTGLWPVNVDIWEGFVFVNLEKGEPSVSLLDGLNDGYNETLEYAKFGLADLQVGFISTHEVKANWKVVIENYNECLHCPSVHPELVQAIPTYMTGSVVDHTRDDGGVALAPGRTMLAGDASLQVPQLPGLVDDDRPASYYGAQVYPLMFLDIDNCSVLASAIFPTGPESCTLVAEYLFPAETLAIPGLDVKDLVSLNEVVFNQDNGVCERVQRGVRSRAFDHGVLPSKDEGVREFEIRYLRDRSGF